MKKRIIIILLFGLLFIPIKINKYGFTNNSVSATSDTIEEICSYGEYGGMPWDTATFSKDACISFLESTDCKQNEQCYRARLCASEYDDWFPFCDLRKSTIRSVCSLGGGGLWDSISPEKRVIEDTCEARLEENGGDCFYDYCFKKVLCEDKELKEEYDYCKIIDYQKEVCSELKSALDKVKVRGDGQDFSKRKAIINDKCPTILGEAVECTTKSCFQTVACEELADDFSGEIDFCKNIKKDDPNEKEYNKYKPENCYGFGEVVYYISMMIKIIQIVAPILLIIWASIDLVKSITSGDEKKIATMRKPIIQRAVAAVVIFLVPAIVSWIIDSFSVNGDEDAWYTCWASNHFRYKSAEPEEDDEEKESDNNGKGNDNTIDNKAAINDALDIYCGARNNPLSVCRSAVNKEKCAKACKDGYKSQCDSVKNDIDAITKCMASYANDFVNKNSNTDVYK